MERSPLEELKKSVMIKILQATSAYNTKLKEVSLSEDELINELQNMGNLSTDSGKEYQQQLNEAMQCKITIIELQIEQQWIVYQMQFNAEKLQENQIAQEIANCSEDAMRFRSRKREEEAKTSEKEAEQLIKIQKLIDDLHKYKRFLEEPDEEVKENKQIFEEQVAPIQQVLPSPVIQYSAIQNSPIINDISIIQGPEETPNPIRAFSQQSSFLDNQPIDRAQTTVNVELDLAKSSLEYAKKGSFEYNILDLMCKLHVMMGENSNNSMSSDELVDKDINQSFKIIKDSSNRYLRPLPSEVQSNVADFLNQVEYQLNISPQDAVKNLQQTLKILRPFNFKEFFEFNKMISDAEKLIEDKEIILLLGTTGSGKSTSIQYLCGSLMQKITVNGLIHIEAVKIANRDLQKVKLSPFSKSETRFVTPVQLDIRFLGNTEDYIYIVDTPGFEDTQSAEIDISNGIGIKRAVSKAESIRPIIVFSYLNLGTRRDKFKQQIEYYGQLILNLKRNVKKFIYFFSHVPEDTFDLSPILQDVKDKLNPSESSNENLKCILSDMINQASPDQQNRFFIIRPLDKNNQKIIKKIINGTEPIESPDQVFTYTPGDNSSSQVAKQIDYHESIILESLKNGDQETASAKMKEIYKFSQIFKDDQKYTNKFNDIKKKTILFFKQSLENGTKNIIQTLQYDDNLRQEDVKEMFAQYTFLKDLEKFRKQFIESDAMSNEVIASTINQSVDERFQLIKQQEEINLNRLYGLRKNIIQLANTQIDEFKKFLVKFEQECQNILRDFFNKARDQIRLINIPDAAQVEDIEIEEEGLLLQKSKSQEESNQKVEFTFLKYYNVFNTLQSNTADETDSLIKQVNDLSDQLKKEVINKISILINKRCNLFNQTEQFGPMFTFNSKEIVSLKLIVNLCKQIKAQLPLKEQELSELISELISERVYLKIKKLFDAHYTFIVNQFQIKQYEGIKQSYTEILELMKFQFIRNCYSQKFNDIKSILQNIVQSNKRNIESILENLKQKKWEGDNLPRLYKEINEFNELKWFLENNEAFYDQVKQSLIQDLSYIIESIKSKVNDINIDLDGQNNIYEAQTLQNQISDINNIIIRLGVKDKKELDTENMSIKWVEEVAESLTKIETFFKDKLNKDPSEILKREECVKIKQYHDYVQYLKQKGKRLILIDDNNLRASLNNVEQMMQLYFDLQNKQIPLKLETNIENIKSFYNNLEASESDSQLELSSIILINTFTLIAELKSKYTELWNKIDQNSNLDDSPIETIQKYFQNIQLEIYSAERLSNEKTLHKLFDVLQNLKQLDRYIYPETREITLCYQNLIKILQQNQNKIIKNAQNSIERRNYENVLKLLQEQSELKGEESRENIKEILQQMQIRCNFLISQIDIYNRSFELMDTKFAQDLNEYIKELLEMQVLQSFDQIRSQLQKVNNTIRSFFEKLKQDAENCFITIKKSMDRKQYYEAFQDIYQLRSIVYQINCFNYVDSDAEESKSQMVGDYNTKLSEFRAQIKTILDDLGICIDNIKTKIEQPNFDVQKERPLEIIKNLRKLEQQPQYANQNKQLREYLETIEDALKNKFLQIYDQEYSNDFTVQDKIRELKKYIKFGNDCQQFQQDVEELQKVVTNEQNIENEQLIQLIEGKESAKEIVYSMRRFRYNISQNVVNKLNDKYDKMSNLTIKNLKIDQKITGQKAEKQIEINEVLETYYVDLWDLQQISEKISQENKEKFAKIKKYLQQLFYATIKILSSKILDQKFDISLIKVLTNGLHPNFLNQTDSNLVQILVSFQKLKLNQSEIANDLIDDIDAQFLTFQNYFLTTFTKQQEIFEISIKNFDTIKIVQSINYFKSNEIVIMSLNNSEFLDNIKIIMPDSVERENFIKKITTNYYKKYCLEVRDAAVNSLEIVKDFSTKMIDPIYNNNQKERETTYQTISLNLMKLQDLSELEEDIAKFTKVEKELSSMSEEAHQIITKNLEDLQENTKNQLQDFSQQKEIRIDLDFAFKYLCIISASEYLHVRKQEMKDLKTAIDNKIDSKLKDSYDQAIKIKVEGDCKQQIEQLKNVLTNIQKIKENFIVYREPAQQNINQILSHFQDSLKNRNDIKLEFFNTLYTELKDSTEGYNLVENSQIFQGFQREIFNQKILTIDLKQVLNILHGIPKFTEDDKKVLERYYIKFEKKYQETVREYLKSDMNLENLAGKIKQFTKDVYKFTWDKQQKIPELAALIFALWTLSEKKDLNMKTGNSTKDLQYLRQPHKSQVISIFILLGLGQKNMNKPIKDLQSLFKKQQIKFFTDGDDQLLIDYLVQIETGQGKSITLAVTSMILALNGFKVSCACYSEILSQRDYKSFEKLFELIGVKEKIKYGTFNEICEDIINEDGNIRDLVLKRVLVQKEEIKEKPKNKNKVNTPTKVLLIDEVDVFFSSSFYNVPYNPIAKIKVPQVEALLDFIWENRKNKNLYHLAKKSSEFNECKNLFKKEYWGIMEGILNQLVNDVNALEGHQYVVNKGKIGYRESDQISYKISYGYITLFVHYLEKDKGNITDDVLKENKALSIQCGSFSYSEIPNMFGLILGTTGTLSSLSQEEEKIIKEAYQIQNFAYMPSIYIQKKASWKKIWIIKNRTDYFKTIVNEINNNLISSDNKRRAVIVFFRSMSVLQEFKVFQSEIKSAILTQQLTELDDIEEINFKINKATQPASVTLTTQSFGRGTDFIVRSKEIEDGGGIHIISTFLPKSKSDQIQIIGRTARQEQSGSFQMVLYEEDLTEFDIYAENVVAEEGNLYEYVQRKRDDQQTILQKIEGDSLEKLKKSHDQSMELKKNLLQEHSLAVEAKIKEHVLRVNPAPSIEDQMIKTLVMMDATGSMSGLITKCKNNVVTMFERVQDILKKKGFPENIFQVQFGCYRNYDCDEQNILQYSPWVTDSKKLVDFMASITARNGDGCREAVEIALWHANEEADRSEIPLSQVIIIGDAAPNTVEEVTSKRSRRKEEYWKTTKFKQPTNYMIEIEKLIPKLVKVSSFYVVDYAKDGMDQCVCNGGVCEKLDVNNEEKGAELLTHCISRQILTKIGESRGGEYAKQLVTEYNKSYA